MAEIDVRGFLEDRLVERVAATLQGRPDGLRLVVLAGDSAARRERAFVELIEKVPGRPRTIELDLGASVAAPSKWPDAFRDLHQTAHGRGTGLGSGLGLGALTPALSLIEALAPEATETPYDAARLTDALAAVAAREPLILRLRRLDEASYLWASLLGQWARRTLERNLRLVLVAEAGAQFVTTASNGGRPVLHQWLDDGTGGFLVAKIPSEPAGGLAARVEGASLPGGAEQAAGILFAGSLVGDPFPIRPVLDALGVTTDGDADAVVDALDDGLADEGEAGAILADVGAKDHLWEPLMGYSFKDGADRDRALGNAPADTGALAGRLAEAVLRRLPRRGTATSMLVTRLRERAGQPEQGAEVFAADLLGQPVEVIEELDPVFVGTTFGAAPRPSIIAVAGWTTVRALPPPVALRLLDAVDKALAAVDSLGAAIHAMALAGRAHAHCAMGNGAEGLAATERAQAFAVENDLKDWELPLLALHSRSLLLERKLDEAERVARFTMFRGEQLKQRSHVGRAKMELAGVQLLRKDPKSALQTLQEALGAFQQAGDKSGQADVHMQLAQAEIARQNGQKADEHFGKAAQLARDGNAPLVFVVAMRNRGRLRLNPQGASEALQLLGPAAQVAGQIGQIPLAADILEDVATAAVLASQARQAQEALIQALRLRESMRHVPGQARVLARLALAFLMAGDAVQATKAIDRSLELAPDGEAALQAWQLRGMIALQQNHHDDAQAALEHALTLTPEDQKQVRAQLMHNLALVHVKKGDEAKADELRAQAHELAPELQPAAGTMSVTFPPAGGDGQSSTGS